MPTRKVASLTLLDSNGKLHRLTLSGATAFAVSDALAPSAREAVA